MMDGKTDLAERIVEELFDLGEREGGLIKSRAIDRVRELLNWEAAENARHDLARVTAEHAKRMQRAWEQTFAQEIMAAQVDLNTYGNCFIKTSESGDVERIPLASSQSGFDYEAWTRQLGLWPDIATLGEMQRADGGNKDG